MGKYEPLAEARYLEKRTSSATRAQRKSKNRKKHLQRATGLSRCSYRSEMPHYEVSVRTEML